ncbi:glycosyltransferase family 90 protein [Mixia osmundae IAM 14324]|uniref:Glycosyl transferase CAP10 domain-containing protein n=1 Tax=Mixia osmundae (strain CBS 9802 / IAM 14324 / JCM 22182 / KY 12970) TaxID=764103 RepID=G7E618_MIXOS|nr:glycosyltransferase family 90 protein [Mixia osmundae IAM 14324]KEI40573.1 glycosyltransferase family 90 protein [Mixia osmundae IAM 14324]GAA98278.1 hypothetical protein E5Q_04961 [Mixia osmundae IAM 14324]
MSSPAGRASSRSRVNVGDDTSCQQPTLSFPSPSPAGQSASRSRRNGEAGFGKAEYNGKSHWRQRSQGTNNLARSPLAFFRTATTTSPRLSPSPKSEDPDGSFSKTRRDRDGHRKHLSESLATIGEAKPTGVLGSFLNGLGIPKSELQRRGHAGRLIRPPKSASRVFRQISLGLLALTTISALWIYVGTSKLRAEQATLLDEPETSLRDWAKYYKDLSLSIISIHDTKPAAPARPRKPTGPQKHTRLPNGWLDVNAKAPHPILELIRDAQKDWEDKLSRQSQTYEEAVAEYKDRYGRNPPAGFERWCAFAHRHKIQLPDEYDQIARDFEPFRALHHNDFVHRHQAMQQRDHTFTVAIAEDGSVSVFGPYAHTRRAAEVTDIFWLFSSEIKRAVNLTFIIDDEPAVVLPWEEKDRLLELARHGEKIGPSEHYQLHHTHNTAGYSNYALACAPDSALRHSERSRRPNQVVGKHAFIYDHPTAADVCRNPEGRHLHGHTVGSGANLGPLVPLLAFAKMSLNSDILATPLEQYSDTYIGYDPPWDEKPSSKLMWRGSTTGAAFQTGRPWKDSQRARLHFMSHDTEGEREIMWTDQTGATRFSNISTGLLNELYLDASLAGRPTQCDEETCNYLARNVRFAPIQGLDESYSYKYVMDVDGNGWSGRFHRLMSTNSLVLKSTVFPEWYQDRIVPWYHYVPVRLDYGDIYDIMAFFRGNDEGVGEHEAMARQLADNGRTWARDFFRRVDMAAYMFRLTLEMASLLDGTED